MRGRRPADASGARLGAFAIVVAVLLVATVTSILALSSRIDAGMSDASIHTAGYMLDASEGVAGLYVASADEVTHAFGHLREDGDFSGDTESTVEHLVDLLTRFERVSSLVVVSSGGAYVHVARDGENFVVHVVEDGEGTPGRWMKIDSRREPIAIAGELPAETGLVEHIVAAAREGRGTPEWTEPFATNTGSLMTWLSVSMSGDRAPTLILGVGIDGAGVARELDDSLVSQRAEIYVLSEDRNVVAPPPYALELMHVAAGDAVAFSDLSGASTPTAVADTGDMFEWKGSALTVERSIEDDLGVPWIIHVRTDERSLNPALADVRSWTNWANALRLLVFAVAVASALALLRPVRDLRMRSFTDPLTGLANRGYFDHVAETLVQRALKRGELIAVMMLDLDDFKAVNDASSHARGDMVLRVVGQTLEDSVRSDSLVCRWGGDEFVVVGTLAASDDVDAWANRLLHGAQLAVEAVVPDIVAAGCSAGYAIMSEKDESPRVALERADRALLDGKATQKGRAYPARGPLTRVPSRR